MELTAADLSGIRGENIRVPLDEFVEVWTRAEAALEVFDAAKAGRWDVCGVVMTCRWMAGAVSRRSGRRAVLTLSPIRQRAQGAMPELIVDELIAAEVMLLRRPPHIWLRTRTGMVEAVCATFGWAWNRSGVRPVPDVLGRAAS